MAKRSLKVAEQYLEKAENAFITLGLTQNAFANRLNFSRSTVSNFLRGKAIYKENFVTICETLKLDWQEITGLQNRVGIAHLTESIENTEQSLETKDNLDNIRRDTRIDRGNYNKNIDGNYIPVAGNLIQQTQSRDRSPRNPPLEIDAVIDKLRQQVKAGIETRCGTMRILDMSQPIELGKIYTQVNILKKISSHRRKNLSEFYKSRSVGELDRFNMGGVEERISGEDAVTRDKKLLILGKPGAGKTTFLKHLAIQCNRDKFQGDLVPFFVTLKEFAEQETKQGLLAYLDSSLASEKQDRVLERVLNKGKALILLDGLDEVLKEDTDRVIREINSLTNSYPDNQYLMTCRIAAKEYTFDKFTEVEIADFNDEQITTFAENWFRNKAVKAETFLERLEKEEPIRELVSNPLLLTLLCISFEELGDFPVNRKELYEEGIDALLKKWDAKRGIRRDKVYKPLSVAKKEDLLSKIAWDTFASGDYFFKQDKAERLIAEYIRNLPEANLDDEALQGDSEVVLKNIEAQHGLLVERAKKIYSFSHLTFQEYFTAREIILVRQSRDEGLQELVSHLFEKRWREVFLLAVAMSPNAEKLVLLMKEKIDSLLAYDEDLQKYLQWLKEKAQQEDTQLQPKDREEIQQYLKFFINQNFSSIKVLYFDLDVNLNIYFDLYSKRTFEFNLNVYSDFLDCLKRNPDFNFNVCLYISLYTNLYFERNLDIETILYCLNQNIQLAQGLDNKIYTELLRIKNKLLNRKQIDKEKFKIWWQINGEVLTNDFRQVMIQYRNIGHDWQFNETQKEKLEQYYRANKFLTQCLYQDCYVSPEVRQYIEETLLLPIAEIKPWA